MLLGACAPKALVTHDCPGANPGVVPININYNGATINVAPDPQTANEGDVLQFNLVGANDVQVSTSGKTAADGWLNGGGKKKAGNAASEKFFVCVRSDLFEGEPGTVTEKDFGYNVNAEGKPQLDPIVRVIRQN
jgi:hypothetical protein